MRIENAGEQRLARTLGQFEHRLEALRAAEIRIGHLAPAQFRREVEEQAEVTGVRRPTKRHQIAKVSKIQRQDPVEALSYE